MASMEQTLCGNTKKRKQETLEYNNAHLELPVSETIQTKDTQRVHMVPIKKLKKYHLLW